MIMYYKGIPSQYIDYLNIDNYLPIKNFFEQNKNNILWITGNIGTGKTTILYMIKFWKKINHQDFNFFCEYDIKSEYGKIIKPINNYEVFGIDDIGIKQDRLLEQYYFELFNEKYLNNTLLVITSNKDIKSFCDNFIDKELGLRIYDRLMTMAKVVKLSGENKRSLK